MQKLPVLEDVLAPGLRLVICGTAVSPESARKRQYYAGPGNRFWEILAETGLTPRRLTPAEYPTLLESGIGLTDVVVVKDQSGVDDDIDFSSTGRTYLHRLVQQYHPSIICFNSKRAAQEGLTRRHVEYGLQQQRIGSTHLFVAPSTSAAVRRWWDGRIWHQLAQLVQVQEYRSDSAAWAP